MDYHKNQNIEMLKTTHLGIDLNYHLTFNLAEVLLFNF